jgi:hypothetical protein
MRILREDKDGKNSIVFEEEEEEPPNTLLTLSSSSDMYSSSINQLRERDLRKGSLFNGGRYFNLQLSHSCKLTRFVREETQFGILTPI